MKWNKIKINERKPYENSNNTVTTTISQYKCQFTQVVKEKKFQNWTQAIIVAVVVEQFLENITKLSSSLFSLYWVGKLYRRKKWILK